MIITRFSKQRMTELACEVEFLTPTFLGGADQNAELRAAPFKNLLRQWWRVACGQQFGDYKEMLVAEEGLFGSVRKDHATVSSIRVNVTADKNKCTFSNDSINMKKTFHPEVGKNGTKIDNALYLGFGPINFKTGPRLYITPGSKAWLTLTFPRKHENTIKNILQYIHNFGTIGSRSRNGWGSLALSAPQFSPLQPESFPSKALTSLLKETDYPVFLGDDGRLLCWQSSGQKDSAAAMSILANSYIDLRTKINIKPNGLQKRHILGYPILGFDSDKKKSTPVKYSVKKWGDRMPSQLRLMVKREVNGNFVGRILHIPHKLPKQWDAARLGTELSVWRDVHQKLDQNNQLQRVGGDQ